MKSARQALSIGMAALNSVPIEPSPSLDAVRQVLLENDCSSETSDGLFSWLVCCLGFKAACLGNFGVGAVVIDAQSTIQATAFNMMYQPKRNSGAHAEMLVINRLEGRAVAPDLSRCTLYSSLEPCPMCVARLMMSEIGAVRYVADDIPGGMVRHRNALPPIWIQLQSRIEFGRATCSAKLRSVGWELFRISAEGKPLGGRATSPETDGSV